MLLGDDEEETDEDIGMVRENGIGIGMEMEMGIWKLDMVRGKVGYGTKNGSKMLHSGARHQEN